MDFAYRIKFEEVLIMSFGPIHNVIIINILHYCIINIDALTCKQHFNVFLLSMI